MSLGNNFDHYTVSDKKYLPKTANFVNLKTK